MSFEVFVQAFHAGESALFPIAVIEAAFAGYITDCSERGASLVLRVDYLSTMVSVGDWSEIFITRDAEDPAMTSGFMMSGPASHPALHDALLALLRQTPSALFWADALVVGTAETILHLPSSMVETLGPPMIAETGAAILDRIRQ